MRLRSSTFLERLPKAPTVRPELLCGGIATICSAAHLALGVTPDTAGRLAAEIAMSALLIGAAAMLGRRIGGQLAEATRLATRFAQGETDLRLQPMTRISELQDLSGVLNSIADRVQDTELQFSLLSEATGDLVWDWNLASDIVTCRRGAKAAIGLAEDTFEFPNSWWMARVDPAHRETLYASFGVAFRTRQRLWSEEYRFRHETGEYRWFWDRGVIVRDRQGTPVRVIGCMTDVSRQRSADETLKASERRYRSLVLATTNIVWSVTPDGKIRERNAAWGEFTGQSQAQYCGHGWLDAIHPDDRDLLADAWKSAAGDGKPYQLKCRVRRSDGHYRWVIARGVPVVGAEGVVTEGIGVVVDIHDEHEARLQLLQKSAELGERVRELRCLHAVAVACNQDTLSIHDILQGAADALAAALMRPEEAGCEITWDGIVAKARGRSLGAGAASEAIQTGAGAVGTVKLGYAEGTGEDLLVEERGLLRTVAALLGQMIAQRADRDRIKHTADHDILTGLPNRWRLQDELNTLLQPESGHSQIALLLIDLDHFKDVNDTLGHDAGDALLAKIASRLKLAIGARGIVARLGGDEFAIALCGLDGDAVETLAEDLLDSVRQPVRFAGRDITPRATIGIATSPLDGVSSAELLKNADIALYSGKSAGRNAVVPYASGMRDAMEQRVRICAEVRDSLAHDVFVPYYQPKVSLQTHHIKGFEALLRWKHPMRGLQNAGAVLPAFEDHELAVELGERIRRHVFDDMCRWRAQGVEFHQVAINLSSAEFARADLAEHLLGQIERCAIPPRCLAVEVTETVLLGRDADVVGPILGKLHDAGVQIALDDFGTGYASLTHLQRYPVDVIKIDQSFIRSILTDPGSQAITSAVLELGRRLGMTVVAEGVETGAHAELLRTAGCDEAQGFYFAKATPASRVPYVLGGSEQTRWGGQIGAPRASVG